MNSPRAVQTQFAGLLAMCMGMSLGCGESAAKDGTIDPVYNTTGTGANTTGGSAGTTGGFGSTTGTPTGGVQTGGTNVGQTTTGGTNVGQTTTGGTNVGQTTGLANGFGATASGTTGTATTGGTNFGQATGGATTGTTGVGTTGGSGASGLNGLAGGSSTGGATTGSTTGGATAGATAGTSGSANGGFIGGIFGNGTTGGSTAGANAGEPTTSTADTSCCSDGDCLCHGRAPTALTNRRGEFATRNYRGTTGNIFYPTDAQPPFAAVALCGGFLNTGPEMNSWGNFYASHGIVTLITNTGALDLPDLRGTKLLRSIDELVQENTKAGSPLNGKLSGRYGTSGYSMGGGGTTLASQQRPSLKSSVGLAAWAPNGIRVQVPTLFLCGGSDVVAPCNGSEGAYNAIPAGVPKMIVVAPGAGHLAWFDQGAGFGVSGQYALAFEKVFLEGDERWKPLLLTGDHKKANIQ